MYITKLIAKNMVTKDDLNIIEEGNRYLLHDMEFGIGIETRGDVFIIALDEHGHAPSSDFVVFPESKLRIPEGVDLNKPFSPNPEISWNYHSVSPDSSIIGPFEHEAHGAYHSCEAKRCYINLNRIDKRIQNILFCISKSNRLVEWLGVQESHNVTFTGLYARVFIGTNWEWGYNMGTTLATIANKGPHKWDKYETLHDLQKAYQTCSVPENISCLKLFNIKKEAECWYLEHSEESYESINNILTKILP